MSKREKVVKGWMVVDKVTGEPTRNEVRLDDVIAWGFPNEKLVRVEIRVVPKARKKARKS
jgi:hypothetical protein